MSARLMRDRRKDRASGILVTSILSMLMLCACVGLALDLGKNAYLKNSQNSHAQQATEVAVKTIDARGSLGQKSANAMVREYLRQSGASEYANDSAAGGASGEKQDETAAYRTGTTCAQREIDGAMRTMPYMRIQLDEKRGLGTGSSSVTFVSEGGSAPVLVSGTLDLSKQYRVISAEVHDSANNFLLSMFGVPCQDLRSTVSGIAFGSQEDLANSGLWRR